MPFRCLLEHRVLLMEHIPTGRIVDIEKCQTERANVSTVSRPRLLEIYETVHSGVMSDERSKEPDHEQTKGKNQWLSRFNGLECDALMSLSHALLTFGGLD